MGRTAFEKVSQREYARRLGVSNEAVSKAVREGRIKTGWNKKEKKIIVELADKEFGIFFKEDVETDLESDTDIVAKGKTKKLTDSSSFVEARRVREIKMAQLAELDVQEREGELVNKEVVYKQLFTFGQNLRTSILAVPDRTIDNILSSKTRSEAHIILTNALHEILETLTKTEQLNFKSQ